VPIVVRSQHSLHALDGLRVVDLGEGMAGALPGMVLADNGADVIKVERPGGDPARSTPGFKMWNRGKRSVIQDLTMPAGLAALRDLTSGADVVIDSRRSGATDVAAGGDCRATTVRCSILGFPKGADGDLQGYEGLVAAVTGRMIGLGVLTGLADEQDRAAPIFPALPAAAYATAMFALQGILAALWARSRTGRGEHVTVSMLDGVLGLLMRQDLARGRQLDPAALQASEAARRGIDLCFLRPRCADGRYLQMCARQDRAFVAWIEAIGLADLLKDERYRKAPLGIPSVADADALEVLIRDRMATKDAEYWLDLFTNKYDVGADPFLTFDEYLGHPQMVLNDRVVVLDDPDVGSCRQVGLLAEMSVTPGEIQSPAEALPASNAPLPVWSKPRRAVPAETTRTLPGGPLEGITVLEVAYFIAGPLGGSLLSELGARVIKVEPPGGDPYRRTGLQAAKFLHGKESIVIDLKAAKGRALLDRFVQRSDVLLQSFRANVLDRLGMEPERLMKLNPQLVYVTAASYGSRGAQADRTAYHSTPNAIAGGGILQAGLGNAPVDDSFADPCSAIAVASAILLGLHGRHVSGRGQIVETTMLASSGYVLSPWVTRWAGMAPDPMPDGGQHGFNALYRLYPCRSGWIFLACVTEGEWARLLSGLGREEWGDDPRFQTQRARLTNDAELVALLSLEFAQRRADELVGTLRKADVPVAVVTEVPQDQWLEREGHLLPASHPDFGDYWLPPPKVHFRDYSPRSSDAAGIGEHGRPLLSEFGLSEDEIVDLEQTGVVGAYSPGERGT
jgi:crotonobetainyl-CoA:carnitine CoA-transferase CaiB-like acyl-CoA transferase